MNIINKWRFGSFNLQTIQHSLDYIGMYSNDRCV